MKVFVATLFACAFSLFALSSCIFVSSAVWPDTEETCYDDGNREITTVAVGVDKNMFSVQDFCTVTLIGSLSSSHTQPEVLLTLSSQDESAETFRFSDTETSVLVQTQQYMHRFSAAEARHMNWQVTLSVPKEGSYYLDVWLSSPLDGSPVRYARLEKRYSITVTK